MPYKPYVDYRHISDIETHLETYGYLIEPSAPREERVALVNDALRDLYLCQGLALRDIGELLSISNWTVRVHLDDAGVTPRPKGGTNHYKDGKHRRYKETEI